LSISFLGLQKAAQNEYKKKIKCIHVEKKKCAFLSKSNNQGNKLTLSWTIRYMAQ